MSSPIEDFIVSLGFDTSKIKSQIQDLHKSLEKLAVGVDAKRVDQARKREKTIAEVQIDQAKKTEKALSAIDLKARQNTFKRAKTDIAAMQKLTGGGVNRKPSSGGSSSTITSGSSVGDAGLEKLTRRQRLERMTANAVAEYERGTVGPSNAGQRLKALIEGKASNAKLRAFQEEMSGVNSLTRNRMKAEGSLKSFDSAAASKADLDLLKANNAIATLRTTMQKLGMDTKELDKSLTNSKDLGSLKTLRENTATQIRQWKILNSQARERADIQKDADAHVAAFQKEQGKRQRKQIREQEAAARKAARLASILPSEIKTKQTMDAIKTGGGFAKYTSDQQNALVQGAQKQSTQKGADAFVRAARDVERYRPLGGAKIDEAIASGNVDQLRTVTKELSRMNHELEKQRRHSIGAAAAMSSLQDSTRNMVREYASLYALFAGTTYFKEQVKALDSMNASILAVSDNSEQAADTVGYLKGVIVQNGLSLKDTTKDFVKLRAAMQDKYSLDQTKQAFESLTKSGIILQLSQDDMAGTVKAVSQMFSKQQVMAQELKEQLKLAA